MSNKTKDITAWVIASLLCIQFLLASIGKLTGGAVPMFENYGYDMWFMYVIGALELIAAICILIPKWRVYAAFLLVIIMMGAAYTHLMHEEYNRMIHNAIIILLSVSLLYLRRKQATPLL